VNCKGRWEISMLHSLQVIIIYCFEYLEYRTRELRDFWKPPCGWKPHIAASVFPNNVAASGIRHWIHWKRQLNLSVPVWLPAIRGLSARLGYACKRASTCASPPRVQDARALQARRGHAYIDRSSWTVFVDPHARTA